MDLLLQKSKVKGNTAVEISGSKSETNRLLLLQALYPRIILANISDSDDSEVMSTALTSNDLVKDIHHAGTTMRFLTAFYAIQEGNEVILTGSSRMKERPIKILVEALQQLDADIEYIENEGFPPLRIRGKKITKNKISIKADVSSQYISALLLIAPKMENGLELTLEGDITSVPYIQMTLGLLSQIGVKTSFVGNTIKVAHLKSVEPKNISVESDWSSASYFYSIVALSEIGTEITLSSYKENSLQGDRALAEIYKNFGVQTIFEDKKIVLRKTAQPLITHLNLDLNTTPDIAQTIAVTCFGLGIGCHLTGLHTLKIKETDRLDALKNELIKLGTTVSVTNGSITLQPSSQIKEKITIKTYQDHRMAMAFAPLALRADIGIEDAEVVSKSYPDFWNDLQNIGFRVSELLNSGT